MQTSLRRSSVLVLLALSACLVGNTDEETLQISVSPLFYSATKPLSSGARVLQGARPCLEVLRFFGAEGVVYEGSVASCYDITRDGAPFEDGSCVPLDALGELAIDYVPSADCRFDELADQIVPDRFRLSVVPIDGLRGELEWWQEDIAASLMSPGPAGTFPADWVPAVAAPLRLVPDVSVAFPVVLRDATDEHVAWDVEQGRLLQAPEGGAARELPTLEDGRGFYVVRVEEGERAALTLALPGGELPVAEVIATPVAAAASLEIVVAYDHDAGETDPWLAPYGGRAVVRDGAGQVIVGAPVEWTLVEGALALTPLEEGPLVSPPEYLRLRDRCVPPPPTPELRRAILRAELGDLTDEVELEWTARPDEEPSDTPFERDPACGSEGPSTLERPGCQCAAQPQGSLFGSIFGLVLLALRRRNRLVVPR